MSRETWLAANQDHLAGEIGRVRRLLELHGQGQQAAAADHEPIVWPYDQAQPPALAHVAEAFSLSPFERDVLLLCAAYELDAAIPALCGGRPTFGQALTLFAGGHWSALAPAAALRYWRLVEVSGDGGLAAARLRIDERVLHHLIGIDAMDDRLTALVRPGPAGNAAPSPAQAELSQQILAGWRSGTAVLGVQLCGDDATAQRRVAEAVAEQAGAQLYILRGEDVPASPYERETLARLWDREAALTAAVLLLTVADEPAPAAGSVAAGSVAAASMVDLLLGPVIVAGRDPLPVETRRLAWFELNRPRWQASLNGPSGRDSRSGAHSAAASDAGTPGPLQALAQHIETLATWDDLVLPAEQIALLREIAGQVRQMAKVYETWGFAARSQRGLGISALFAGESGTGKTMAAEVLANELGLPLYRIDLSAVVSKYIGETEKNLRRVFDAAETTGAILLFDEADALFGKRSEVKDSHDRYANIEVSYLLQRMESYVGLAILTTNFKSALDPAFLRRIRFMVNFPFPDASQRAEIWRRIFPAQTPLDGMDVGRLTRLSVAGGNIRNIAVNAAFLAADAGEPVGMSHLFHAARREYAKLEKPLSELEFASRP